MKWLSQLGTCLVSSAARHTIHCSVFKIEFETLLLRSAGTVAAVLFETQNDESEVILRTHLLNRTALAARTLKKVAGTPSINHALQ